MRVSAQLFHWQPTEISFKLTKVSLSSGLGVDQQNPFCQLAFVSLRSPPSVSSAQVSKMGNNADVKLMSPLRLQLFNFDPEASPVNLGRNHFMSNLYILHVSNSFYIVNTAKKAVWPECSVLLSVLNPNNVCVSCQGKKCLEKYLDEIIWDKKLSG